MAADNEAPVASSSSNSRPGEGSGNGNADGGDSSKNDSGKDDFRRNPRHDHRTRGNGRSEKGRGEWGRQKNDKRKKNDEYHEFKRRKLNNRGDDAKAEAEAANPFSKDEIAAEGRRPKRKVAVMIGYAGTGYKGMQVNGNEKTIEADLFKAFVATGAISKANADDPKKSSLVRCARTDKGVHAAGNVISLKLIIEDDDIVEKINASLPEQIRVWDIQRTNNSFSCYQLCDSRWYEYLMPSYCLLPPHPETFLGRKLVELAKEHGEEDNLNAKMADVKDFWTEVEEKEIKPIMARLDPEVRAAVLERLHVSEESEPTGGDKETEENEEKAPEEEKPVAETPVDATTEPEAPQANIILESHQPKGRELGPIDFALRDIKAAYVSAKRRYRITPGRLQRLQETLDMYNGTRNFHNYTVQKPFFDPSAKRHIKSFVVNPKPIIINDTEWLSLKVHGQSFMMHQIRKMVGLASLVVRCGTPLDRIEESYQNQKMAIPKAPGLGLLLEHPVFHNYNRRATESLQKETIDFDKYQEKIQAFKDKEIYQRIFNVEEKENSFHMFFNQIDQFKTNHFLWLTAGGMKAAEIARDTTGEKVQRDVDKRLGDDEEDEDPEGGEG
ncbi:tRNA pseudouridine synthase 1 [Neonectria punicea]|uniref:tRNA pseudouridine synthase 1 n=1 Tax=Neonectria punicea TaxID=979145 RepID=A0ABR1GNY1_9HYPO